MSRQRVDAAPSRNDATLQVRLTKREKQVLARLARKMNVPIATAVRTLIAREAAAQGVTYNDSEERFT